jgi:outer membrane protein assembly factor BamA
MRIYSHKTMIIPLLLGLAICSSMLLAQPVARILSVNFSGNQELSERQLRLWLGWKKGDVWDQQLLAERIAGLLTECRRDGYYFSRVDSTQEDWTRDSSRVRLEVFFHEGGRPRVASLQVTGDTLPGVNPEDVFHTTVGGTFRRDVFYNDMDALLDWYGNRGYPFCKVEPEQVEVDSGNPPELHLSLKVDQGPLVKIGFLSVAGNVRTRRNVALRETRINAGEIYRQHAVDRSVRRLRRLGFFSTVDNPIIVKDKKDRWGLHYQVVEMPTYRFNGVIGYLPGAGNREGYFSGLVDIILADLMGTGRLFEAHWNRQGPGVQELAVRYEEPWLLGFPLNMGLGFQQRVEDTLYVRRSWDVGLTWPITDIVSVWGSISREEVLPDSSGVLFLGLERSNSWTGELGVTVDTRDEPLNPTSGYYYKSSGSFGVRHVQGNGGDSFDERRVSLDVEGVWEPLRFWVLDLQAHGREYISPQQVVPLPFLYRLGGATSLRGYREEQFLGQRIAWTNTEWRRVLGRLSRAYVFLDTGYYFRNVETASGAVKPVDDFLVGWGIGMRVETGIGVIGFDYGLGEGDRITNGKVHFRLTNQF